jgi:hypothetical protein
VDLEAFGKVLLHVRLAQGGDHHAVVTLFPIDRRCHSGARFTNVEELFLTQILNAILNRLRIDS